MFRSYILTAWRSLAKNRLNASINILGLTVAFTCNILLFLMAYHEFSFDSFQENRDRIYKLYNITYAPDGDQKSTSMAYPAVPTLKAEVPGIEWATALMPGGQGIRYHGKELDKGTMLVDKDFFRIFSFKVLTGNATSPLENPGDVVLSRSAATAVFGAEYPIGKTVEVKVANDWKNLVVSAVTEDAPENSSINYDILARVDINGDYASQKNSWNIRSHPVYVQLSPGATHQQVENGLKPIVKKYITGDNSQFKGYRKDSDGNVMALRLMPFNDLHFDEELGTGKTISKPYLYILILIAAVVLVIACFNFINLQVAFAFVRAREIGIRKANGAGKNQIFVHLWLESFVLCMVAFFLSMAAALVLLGSFNSLFNEQLRMGILLHPVFLFYTCLGILLTSFLAGGYPAWLISRFKTTEVLKGKFSFSQSLFLRNGLITFQFVMASLLLCGTFIIYRQFRFLRTAPLGYEQESVISIPIKNSGKSQQYIRELRDRLSSDPQVAAISAGSNNIGIGNDMNQATNSGTFNYKNKTISTDILLVDYDFLRTLGIKATAGRDFGLSYYSADTSSNVINIIVTESAAREFGEKDVAGLAFYPGGGNTGPRFNIIGVVPDIHLYSLRQKIQPVTMMMARTFPLNYIFVKVKTDNPLRTIQKVSETYRQIEPDNTIGASFLSENTQHWYKKEQRLSAIFTASAVLAIVLSCLGLFAIVSLVMQQRRKEVGMRKILGASLWQINILLSKDFIRLVFISFLIATPVAWYFLHRWLMNFEYSVSISWWIFPATGLLLILIALLTIGAQTIKMAVANPVDNLKTD